MLPLRQPILYEKVFQSLTNLALKLLTDDPSIAIRVSAFPVTKLRRNDFGDNSGDSQDAPDHALSAKKRKEAHKRAS